MEIRLVLLSFLLPAFFFSEVNGGSGGIFAGLCPEPLCECQLDSRGRMEISCENGQMTGIPMERMNPSTEVIKIVGPRDKPNNLTIGRLFKQFKRLEELHIVGSNIPNIGENSFWGIQSLRVLDLSRNSISNLIESNFKGLVNVENMSLAENAIESLVSASFVNLPQLRSLDLSRNRVSKLVERLFYGLHMLEYLDLSENHILELNPDVFRDIWRLRELRCRKCALNTINPLLYALLPGLEVLDLGLNEFQYLRREEFSRLPRLHTLYLDGNLISSIVDHAFHSVQLKILTLGHNRIARVDRFAFFNATIERLDLSANKFESLDKLTFTELRTQDTLKELDLSRNPRLKISPLIIILSENPQLEGLSLAYNELEDIPLDLFELQGNLRYLNLSGNRLNELYLHHFTHLHSLRVLDLSWNLLKGLDGDILTHIDRVATFQDIRLEGNPWHCDLCHIVSLLKWVQRTSLFKDGCSFSSENYAPNAPTCLRCSAPPVFQGRNLLSLEESDLGWCSSGAEPVSILSIDDPKLGLFLGCGIIIIFLMAASIYVIVRSRYQSAHYYTREGDRPEIATPPVPPPLIQEVTLFPESNGNHLNHHNLHHHHHQNDRGFDNLLFQHGVTPQSNNLNGNSNGHHHYPPQWTPVPTSGGGGGGCGGGNYPNGNRDKMIATIEEMSYETQLAYPELGPIVQLPPPPRHPSPCSSRSTPIYCCPGHNNNNSGGGSSSGGGGGGGGSITPPRSSWMSTPQSQSFRRY
ncbi:unnamed protein product [Orchesella dallaii]|uniref:Leucine-rich repeat-containing protein 15 n=1 Tax=Orchesella dallaii TaxID=48710 RepID=A0ABP1S0R5_9HEXA